MKALTTLLRFSWLGISLLLPVLALHGLQLHEYDSDRHDRFEAGSFPEAPVPNASLWAGDQVFNGVGWSADDRRKGFALISPRHFVGANHFRPPLGSEVRFLSADGQVRSYTYVTFYSIENDDGEPTDIFLGELAEDIPAEDNIPLHPVLDRPESELVDRELLVYGRGNDEPRIGRGVIRRFSDSFGTLGPITSGPLNDTRNYSFEYAEQTAEQDDAYGEVGDSGSPSFILEDGMLTISGIHSAIESTDLPATGKVVTTYDSFLLHYADQIDTHLSKTGHRLTLAPLGDLSLELVAFELRENTVRLTIHNPSQAPYDVQRTLDDVGDWETVETGLTGETWEGPVPGDAGRSFWRLMRYPLPISSTEGSN